jgi:undecaprenyl-diphosphatase
VTLTRRQGAVLGLVQGVTEFVPISSSGHLLGVPLLLGWDELLDDPAQHRALTTALHAGTAIGATAVLWPQMRPSDPAARRRLAMLLVGGSIPSAVAGALLADRVDSALGRPGQIAALLAGFGLLLAGVDSLRAEETEFDDMQPRHVAGMATGQALALAPGVSRAGVTIMSGRLVGLDRGAASRASYLMGLPVTVGAAAYSLATADRAGLAARRGPLLLGVATAAVSGGISLQWYMNEGIRGESAWPVAAYRCAAAAVLALVARRKGRR